MKNFTYRKFDKIINELLFYWEKFDISEEFTAVKRSLSFEIRDKLYKKYYSENALSNLKFYKKKTPIIYRVTLFLKHIITYCFYSIKWMKILFHNKRENNFVIVSFLPDKKNSVKYLDEIINILPEKTSLIHLGMRYEKKFFINPNFYCFPFFIYRFLIKIDLTKKNTYITYLTGIISKANISISVKTFHKPIKHSLRTLAIYKKLLTDLKKRGNIIYFIQDFDFLGIGYIMNYIFKSNAITVYSIDHALALYNYQFTNRTSDHFLVWGMKEKKRLQNFCNIPPNKVSIVGHPTKKFNPIWIKKKDKYIWLYFMNSYRRTIFHSTTHSWDKALERIKNINALMNKFNVNLKLIIKPHPLDHITEDEINIEGLIVTNEKFERLLPNTQIIFFEDTSVGIDILNYNIPFAYVNTQSNSIYSSMFSIPQIQRFNIEEINNILNKKIPLSRRKEIYESFYCSKKFTFNKIIF